MRPYYLTWVISSLLLACTAVTIAKDYSKGGIKDNTAKGKSVAVDGKKFLDLVNRVEDLENKLTEEKSLVSDLEQQLNKTSSVASSNSESISNIEDKITGIIETVNVDENYWNASATCGGSIVAQTGQINIPYRIARLIAETTSFNSVCVWIVRANYRSKIKLSGTSNALGTYVTEFTINDDGTHSSKTTVIGPSKNYIFNGPLIIITGFLTSVGSVIVFEGFGKQIHQDVDFQNHYLTGTVGHFSSLVNPSDNKTYTKRFQTISINIGRSILAELAIHYNQNCLNSSLLYHQNSVGTSASGSNGTSSSVVNSRCCFGSDCPDQKFYTLDNWFTLTHSTTVLPVGNVSMLWTSKSNKTTSEQCGDVLMGKSGSIVYKRNINYLNNERCVWIIYPFPKSIVRISQVASGMESTYDHLVVTEVDNSTIANYELAAPPLFRRGGDFKGRFIIVTFFTDSSIFRRGFELYWEAIGPSDPTRNLGSEQISKVLLKDRSSLTVPLNRNSKWSTGFQLYMISGIEAGGVEMHISATNSGASSSGNCGISNTKIVHSVNGHVYGNDLSTLNNACSMDSSPNHITVRSSDGIVYILHEESAVNSSLVLHATWTYLPVEEAEVEEDSRCGGLVHGSSGKINYKLDDLYDNGERCIWVLHIPSAPRIEISLMKDGFESCCDFIMVNTINPSNGSINDQTTLITRANNTVTFDGPVLIITFRSDGSVNGRGFSLKFTAIRVGPVMEHEYQYRIVHRDEPTGSFQFMTEIMNAEKPEYLGDKQLFILSYSSPTEPADYAYGVNFNATVEDVILHTNADCESDQLNFFINPTRDGFTLAEHYPTSNCLKAADGTCFNCTLSHHAINDTSLNAFGSTNRAFVAIYKPVEASTQQHFQVDWDTSAGCGGILSGNYGRVTYKLGGRYKNSEQCTWTLYGENVKEFKFTLGRNGFESCCDYIILNSLNPENGSLDPSVVLKTASPFATVRGPTVFITFKSDTSVAGEGFSLQFFGSFTTNTTTTPSPYAANTLSGPRIFQIPPLADNETLIHAPHWRNTSTPVTPATTLDSDYEHVTQELEVDDHGIENNMTVVPTYNYMHYHSRRRNASFTYPRAQGFPSLGPNEILTFVYSPEAGRHESFDFLGSQVTITQMHLKLEENCLSDSVRIYERNISDMIPAREFTVDQASPNMTVCDQDAPAAWKCDNCPALLTRSQQLTFRTTQIGFIVIFKSVAQKQPEQSFSIDWTDSRATSTS